MSNDQKRKILAYAACLAVILLWGLRIWNVNVSAYDFEEEIYPAGEWVALDGNFFYTDQEGTQQYSVRVSSAEILKYAEFMKRFGKDENYLAEATQKDVVLLKVDFRNDGNSSGGVFIRDFNILNEARSQYFSKSDIYMKIANLDFNSHLEGITVKPGTEASLYMVYPTVGRADGITYLESQRGANRLTMYLNVSLYPVKKVIELEMKYD